MSTSGKALGGEVKLERPINLLGGVALVIGGVIGMGIYALIAVVGAYAGTSLWLAFLLAIIISVIGVAPLIQLASALPRAGGGYLYVSRLLNPLTGTVTSYMAILGGASCTAMVAYGLSGYLAPYLPWTVPPVALAVAIPLLFLVLFFFGLRLATRVQVVLTAQLVIALLYYGGAGVVKSPINFLSNLPQGAGGLVMAVILCYSVCMGFQVIAEMGEEMVNARRNIPLSLMIGGGLVLLIYLVVGMVFISAVPYSFEAIKSMKAPLMETGAGFLPPFWVAMLSLGALSAGLTSFNAGAIALPRELFSQARDMMAPAVFAKIDRRTGSPLNAVIAYFLFTILLVLLGQSIDFYGVMTAVGILLMTALIAIAAVRLPSRFPERYEKSYFKMSRPALVAAAVLSVLSSLGFVFIVLTEAPAVGLIYAGWTVLVIVYYLFRVRVLKKKGYDWKGIIGRIPGFDE